MADGLDYSVFERWKQDRASREAPLDPDGFDIDAYEEWKRRGIGDTAIERPPEGSYPPPEILESNPGLDLVGSRAARMDWVLRDESQFYAPYSAHALASFPTNPMDRVRLFAERMFPDVPVDRAMSRFGVKDGRVFVKYVDAFERGGEPNAWGAFIERNKATNPATGQEFRGHFVEPETFIDDPASYVAGAPGPLMPIAGSIAGEVAGIPGGLAGMTAGGAAGGAAGDVARQGVARALVGPTHEFNPGQTGYEAAFGAAGGAAGRALTGFRNRKLASDFRDLNDPAVKRAMSEVMTEAEARGIQLTPAEITNLPTLISEQHALQNMPTSAPTLRKALMAREDDVADAVSREFDDISTVPTGRGVEMSREGAAGVIDELVKRRTAATEDTFRQAIDASELGGGEAIVLGTGPLPDSLHARAGDLGGVRGFRGPGGSAAAPDLEGAGGSRAARERLRRDLEGLKGLDQGRRARSAGSEFERADGAGNTIYRDGFRFIELSDGSVMVESPRGVFIKDSLAEARRSADFEVARAKGGKVPPVKKKTAFVADNDGAVIYRERFRFVPMGDGTVLVQTRGASNLARRQIGDAKTLADRMIRNAENAEKPIPKIRTISQFFESDLPGLKIDVGDIYDNLSRAHRVSKGKGRTILKEATDAFIAERRMQDGMLSDVDVTLRGLHNTKKALDGILERIEGDEQLRATGIARFVSKARADLVDRLRFASEGYDSVMDEFTALSPEVDLARDGLVGAVARRQAATDQGAPKALLNGTPRQITDARRLFFGTGKAKEWNASLRAFLEAEFDAARREVNPGSFGGVRSSGFDFFKRVMGDRVKRSKMKAAMSPEQFASFNRLSRILEATGRVPQSGSMTAFNRETLGQLRRRGAGAIASFVNGLSRGDITMGVGRYLDEISSGRYNRKLAEILVSPNAMKQLDRLKQVSPGSRKAQAAALQLFIRFLHDDKGDATGEVVPQRFAPGEDGAPPAPTGRSSRFIMMKSLDGDVPFAWSRDADAWIRMDLDGAP